MIPYYKEKISQGLLTEQEANRLEENYLFWEATRRQMEVIQNALEPDYTYGLDDGEEPADDQEIETNNQPL